MLHLLFIVALLAVVASLVTALVHLTRESGDSRKTVRALTWRTLLSIALFILLLLAFAFGLLQPHAPGFVRSSSGAVRYHQ